MSKQDGGEKGKGGSSQQGKRPNLVTLSGQNIVITGTGGNTVVTSSGRQPTTHTVTYGADSSSSSSSSWSDSEDGLVLHEVSGQTIIGARGNIQAANLASVHLGPSGPSQRKKPSKPKKAEQKQPQKDCFPKDYKAWLMEHEVSEGTVEALIKDGFDSFKIFACINDSDISDLKVNKGQQRLLQHLAREAQKMKRGGAGSKGADYDSGVTDYSDGNITVKNSRMIMHNVQGGDVAMVRIGGPGRRAQTSHFHTPMVAGVVGNIHGQVGDIVVSSNVTRGDGIKSKCSSKVWQGALSDQTLSYLSENLGDGWEQVFTYLNVQHAKVQQARSDHRTTSTCIRELLHHWRNSYDGAEDGMVDVLLTSLETSGRNDLKEEVKKRHYHSQESAPASMESAPYQSAQHTPSQEASQPVPPLQLDPAPDLSLHPNLQHSGATTMQERDIMDVDSN